MTETTEPKKEKVPKKKGMIRWEALLPASLLCLFVGGYFTVFFDLHLRKGIEYAGYHALGAEVNVADLDTSFKNASLIIKGLELTDPKSPSQNLISIGEIRFDLLWDALLRAKFVVEVAGINQIQFHSKRKTIGRVKPPDENQDNQNGLKEEAAKLKEEALDKVKESYGDNVLGNIANLLSGENGEAQIKNLENNLKSKELMKQIELNIGSKQNEWDLKIKELSQNDFGKKYNESVKSIKTSDFKSPDEVQASVKKADALIKTVETDIKSIEATGKQLQSDLSDLDGQLKSLESSIQSDIKSLESHFKIPQLDANAITQNLFNRYSQPLMSEAQKYQSMITKYLPSGLTAKVKGQGGKNETEKEEEPTVVPRPREKGISYEFGKPNAYPLVWIRKTQISSKATPGYPALGNIEGQALNISSNQNITGLPLEIQLKANFPELQLQGIEAEVQVNHTKKPFKDSLKAQIASYPVDKKLFIESKDLEFGFNKATGRTSLAASFSDKVFQFSFSSAYQNLETISNASQKDFDSIFKNIMGQIPVWTVSASGEGEFPKLPIRIESNLGSEIAQGFERVLKEKIKEAQAKVKKIVDEAIYKEKNRIEAQYQLIKTRFQNEVKKIQDSVYKQKLELENIANKIQKEESKKAQQQLEKEVQKKLGPDAKKKLDDLKKQFKF